MIPYITTHKELSNLNIGQIAWIKKLNSSNQKEWKKVVITSKPNEYASSLHFADINTGYTDCMLFSEPHYDGYFKLEEFYDKNSSLSSIPKIIATNKYSDGSELRTQKPCHVEANEEDLSHLTIIGKLFIKLKVLNIYRYKPKLNSRTHYNNGYNLWNPISWFFLFFAIIFDIFSEGFNNFNLNDFSRDIFNDKYFPHNMEKIKVKWKDIF